MGWWDEQHFHFDFFTLQFVFFSTDNLDTWSVFVWNSGSLKSFWVFYSLSHIYWLRVLCLSPPSAWSFAPSTSELMSDGRPNRREGIFIATHNLTTLLHLGIEHNSNGGLMVKVLRNHGEVKTTNQILKILKRERWMYVLWANYEYFLKLNCSFFLGRFNVLNHHVRSISWVFPHLALRSPWFE